MRLRLPRVVNSVTFLTFFTLYVAAVFYVTRSALPIVAALFFVCDLGIKLVIGQPQVVLPSTRGRRQGTVSLSFVFSLVGLIVLVAITAILASFHGLLVTIGFASVCCLLMLIVCVVSALIFGKRSSQGHLEFPSPLKGMRRAFSWILASVVFGVALGALLLK